MTAAIADILTVHASGIRLAVESDIPRMVEMGERFNQQSTYQSHLKVSREQIAKLGRLLIKQDSLIVSERKGELTGMLGFTIYEHFMSGEKVAGEIFWWVEPECRGDGIRLLRDFDRRAKEAGAKKIQMIAPIDKVAKVYERLGYKFVESTFQKQL